MSIAFRQFFWEGRNGSVGRLHRGMGLEASDLRDAQPRAHPQSGPPRDGCAVRWKLLISGDRGGSAGLVTGVGDRAGRGAAAAPPRARGDVLRGQRPGPRRDRRRPDGRRSGNGGLHSTQRQPRPAMHRGRAAGLRLHVRARPLRGRGVPLRRVAAGRGRDGRLRNSGSTRGLSSCHPDAVAFGGGRRVCTRPGRGEHKGGGEVGSRRHTAAS